MFSVCQGMNLLNTTCFFLFSLNSTKTTLPIGLNTIGLICWICLQFLFCLLFV